MTVAGDVHEEVAELLGAYALDAVEADERELVEAHMLECAVCASEVSDHREVVAQLAGDGHAVPEGLWDKVTGHMDEAPPPLRLVPVNAPIASRGLRSKTVSILAAVTALAAAVAAVAGLAVVRQLDQLQNFEERVSGGSVELAAREAGSDPSNDHVSLVSNDGKYYVEAVISEEGRGFIFDGKLPRLADDRTYQLWGVTGTQAISLGILGNDPEAFAFILPEGVKALAITNEVDSGVVSPLQPPVVLTKSLPTKRT